MMDILNETKLGRIEQYEVIKKHAEVVYKRLCGCHECDELWNTGSEEDPEDCIGKRVYLQFCREFNVDPDYGTGMRVPENAVELLEKYEAILEVFKVK